MVRKKKSKAKNVDAWNEGNTKDVNISQKIPSVSILEQMKSGKALDEKFKKKYGTDEYGNEIDPYWKGKGKL